jgi:chloramphenicol-sensitive protein RarD
MRNYSESALGTFYASSAFILWGVLPVYWKLLSTVPAEEILAHRISWSAVFVILVLLYTGRKNFLTLLLDPRKRLSLILTGALIGVNWFTYIYAVHIDRIVEASMGYYINPLISIFLGLFVLKERLDRIQWIALILAMIGVLVVTFHFGRIPWIALVLSVTFGMYGLIKKIMNLDALSSLGVETLLLAPIAGCFIVIQTLHGAGSFLTGEYSITLLLFLSGAVTALPLYWFAQGARRIPLTRIGFLQYVAPTLMLIIGVVVYSEPFTTAHTISFGLIWAGLALYTISLIRKSAYIGKRMQA